MYIKKLSVLLKTPLSASKKYGSNYIRSDTQINVVFKTP